jgi:hypothetical protein
MSGGETATSRTSIISWFGTGHQNPGIWPAAFSNMATISAAAAKPESRKVGCPICNLSYSNLAHSIATAAIIWEFRRE